MRRIPLVFVVLLAATLAASQAPAPPPQQPTFRGGTNLVQVDAVVTDPDRRPIVDLTAADFAVLDDGKPVAIDRVRFLGADVYTGDTTLAPIHSHDDEEREASRDDVHVYAIVLDDYHVPRMGELRVIDSLLAFVEQLPATDLVALYYPLDSVTDVAFSRDRAPVLKGIKAFYGRQGDYTPKHPVEEEHLRHPQQIESIRRQIVVSALQGLAIHLGGIKQGRKTIVWVTEAFSEPIDDLRDLYEAANRSNAAIYPLDPRGLSTDRSVDRPPTAADVMAGVLPAREFMRALATETGGRTIFGNDVRVALKQVIQDSSAYYLIAYESPHPDDGKFHRVTVRVKRPRATVFARTGYWSLKQGTNSVTAMAPVAAVPHAVQTAVDQLADSLRPDADEPPEGRRRVIMPPEVVTPNVTLLAVPTVSLARGQAVGEPQRRHEFRRTDTIVVRTVTSADSVSARLLDRRGQALTDLPVSQGRDPEVRLPLGGLGLGDYVIEMSARSGDELAQQFVAFRVVR
ncbi:MAG TPA: VWA domain-containing protein [Vicinamibacterales bacterium]